MYQGDLISTKTFVTFDVYIFVGMFYLILTIPLSMLVRYLEKRLAKEACKWISREQLQEIIFYFY